MAGSGRSKKRGGGGGFSLQNIVRSAKSLSSSTLKKADPWAAVSNALSPSRNKKQAEREPEREEVVSPASLDKHSDEPVHPGSEAGKGVDAPEVEAGMEDDPEMRDAQSNGRKKAKVNNTIVSCLSCPPCCL